MEVGMASEDGCGNEKDDEKRERCELWHFYEKAVEGRNFHYRQYVTFVNQYSIFTGALFVAFYTLLGKHFYFALFVAVLGLVTSVLWLCSVKGFYIWNQSWINIVKFYEERLNKDRKVPDSCFVYGLFHEDTEKSCILTRAKRYSTQKLTMLFVYVVLLSWIMTIVWLIVSRCCPCICEMLKRECMCFTLIICAVCLLLVFIIWGVYSYVNKELYDNVDNHYKLTSRSKIKDKKVEVSFVVNPPPQKNDLTNTN